MAGALPVVLVCVVGATTTVTRLAHADATSDQLQQIMTEEYPANLGPAKTKLNELLSGCMKKGCSAPTKAQIYVALGMVASQFGSTDEAKTNFETAIKADADAKLPSTGVTPNIKQQFADVKSALSGGGAGGGGGGDAPATPSGDEQPAGKAPPGWTSYDAFKLALEGLKADQDGKLDECIEKDKASLKAEEQPRTRLHLASCESRANKLVDALRDAQKALEVGIAKKDAGVMKVSRTRVKELIDRIPHVTFAPPSGGITDLSVKFDDRPVPVEALTKKFSIDPGKHTVLAEGTVNGFPATYEEELDVKEKDLITVRLTLKPSQNSKVITQGQIQCMLQAKNQEEVQKCLPQNRKNLVIRLGADFSGYSDTNHVNVITPGINASVISPTSGWNIGGHYILDVVSAASPDLVSEASPPFHEARHAGGITGGYKPGLYGAQANFNVSSEPDYLSTTAGIAFTADVNDKLSTPRLSYSFSYDKIGRGPAPPGASGLFPGNWLGDIDPDHKGVLTTHEIEASTTFVLSPTSILLVGGTAQFERGDQSKPYRYVPIFDPVGVAPFVPVGATVDLVNRVRLPPRPLEQLPTERDRFAVGGRYNKRIGSSTFRIEERLYYDSWQTKASSTDARYMVDLSKHLRVWPHLRFHGQSGANFYQLAYSGYVDQGGTLILPTYRSGDRELAPLITVTGGGGARIALGNPEGEIQYGLNLAGDVMYTRFLRSLFVTTRTGVYGTVAFDVEF